MFRRARENGPAVLVPLAWTFVTSVHLDVASDHALLIAHVVMATIIVGFTVLSWSEMATGVLLIWRRVLLIGLVITMVGVTGFFADTLASALFTVSIVGWMTVPAVALVATGRVVDRSPEPYLIGGTLSLIGAVAYVAGALVLVNTALSFVGLTLVTVGQTAGILNAVVQY